MADDGSQASSGTADSTALNEIATNGALLNQNISALTNAIGGLSGIVLPATNGGTGLNHVNAGDLLYGSDTNVYSLLSDVATGNALISGGVGGAPSWGKITPGHLSGVLPVTSGGTDQSSLTANAVLIGEGTNAVGFAPPGSSGQILKSNGPSSDPTFQPLIDGIGSVFGAPANGTTLFWLDSPFACTITATTTICTSGTCTATFQINGTNIGGSANSVSTTQTTQTHSSSNLVNVGDNISIVISSNASCANMSFMVTISRL
jgi:hypothetical protein